MRSYQIQDVRAFMKKLLISDTFDPFLLSEGSITTFATFHVDGSFHADYLDTAEAELLTTEKCGYTLWKRVRPFFFELTRGRHTPLSFRIVLRLAPYNVEKLLRQSGLALPPDDVDGLFVNILFDGTSLTCTSGTSLRVFSLDKTLERAWDEMLEKFFRRQELPFT